MGEAWRWRMVAGASLGALLMALSLWLAETLGVSKSSINVAFLVLSIVGYAAIGLVCRTTLSDEYYVAGRRIGAPFNGMATAADWMSAATFISMAGGIAAAGYGASKFLMGWTGGFVLLTTLMVPYLRKFGKATVPDFVGDRFYSNGARLVAVICAIFICMTYIVRHIIVYYYIHFIIIIY